MSEGKKDCCKYEANLETVQRGDWTESTCRVCGCRHIRLKVDPVKVGMTGKGLG